MVSRRRRESAFEEMIKERKHMTAIMVLPLFDAFELLKFCRLNKASNHIMNSVVNFKVLFKD
jgi:hypothetical protein